MSETTTVYQVELPRPPASKWEREHRAFLQLLPELRKTHLGQYVAIHDGRVVDAGDNEIELIKRVHASVGYFPIHVEQVTERPVALARIPHYREYRPEAM